MSDDTTLLTAEAPAIPTPAAPAAATPVPDGGPKAKPDGSVVTPAATPAPAKPDGSPQDPAKAPQGNEKPAGGETPKPPAPTPVTEAQIVAALKAPEGIEIDPVIGEKFAKTLLDKTLSDTDRAQQLVDLQSEIVKKTTTDAAQQFEAMKGEWKSDTLKVLGHNAKEQLGLAASARDTFGTAALNEILEQTGLGNHPAVIQFFISIGKAIKEDSFVVGKPGARGDKTAADIIYPALTK